jgi:hypothetical protein
MYGKWRQTFNGNAFAAQTNTAESYYYGVAFWYCNTIKVINLNLEICHKEQKATIYFYVNLENYGNSIIN